MWDNLTCWQPARIGDVVEVNCPELFSQFMSEEDFGQFRTTHDAQSKVLILFFWVFFNLFLCQNETLTNSERRSSDGKLKLQCDGRLTISLNTTDL